MQESSRRNVGHGVPWHDRRPPASRLCHSKRARAPASWGGHDSRRPFVGFSGSHGRVRERHGVAMRSMLTKKVAFGRRTSTGRSFSGSSCSTPPPRCPTPTPTSTRHVWAWSLPITRHGTLPRMSVVWTMNRTVAAYYWQPATGLFSRRSCADAPQILGALQRSGSDIVWIQTFDPPAQWACRPAVHQRSSRPASYSGRLPVTAAGEAGELAIPAPRSQQLGHSLRIDHEHREEIAARARLHVLESLFAFVRVLAEAARL